MSISIMSKKDDKLIETYVGGFNSSFNAPIGTIVYFAYNCAPTGYLLCDGSSYKIVDYPELYEAIGTTYDKYHQPETTFRIPNFIGRLVIDNNTDSFFRNTFGDDSEYLARSNLANHNHTTTKVGNHTHTHLAKGSHRHGGEYRLCHIGSGTGSSKQVKAAYGNTDGRDDNGTMSAGKHSHTLTEHSDHVHGKSLMGNGVVTSYISVVQPYVDAVPYIKAKSDITTDSNIYTDRYYVDGSIYKSNSKTSPNIGAWKNETNSKEWISKTDINLLADGSAKYSLSSDGIVTINFINASSAINNVSIPNIIKPSHTVSEVIFNKMSGEYANITISDKITLSKSINNICFTISYPTAYKADNEEYCWRRIF